MNLCINTTAADKSQAVCNSLTDLTPVSVLQDLTLGDTEPLTLTFTDGAGGPAWAGNAAYTPTFAIGLLDPDGLSDYQQTTSFTPATAGWTGAIALNTQQLIDNMKLQVGSAVDWTRFPLMNRQPFPRPYGGWFSVQVAITDPSGNLTSYADLRVFMRSRVIQPGAMSFAGSAGSITTLALLAAVPTGTFAQGAILTWIQASDSSFQAWQMKQSNAATGAGVQRANDWATTGNVWFQAALFG